jgi:hypothetical protein
MMISKRKSDDKVRHAGRSEPDLGQKEARLEKVSEEELRHMEGGKATESARQQKAKNRSK